MNIIKSIKQTLFRKKKMVQPIAHTPVARSLGFCMIFAGCDKAGEIASFGTLEINNDDLKRFSKLPDNLDIVAFIYCFLKDRSNFNLDFTASSILIHHKNNELFIYIETRTSAQSEILYINKPLKDINLTEYMNNELVDFCNKIQLNFELNNKLNCIKKKKLQKI